MATMMPESISSNAPWSEKRVFSLLRDDPATNGWVVMHSFRTMLLNQHSGWRREIDFLMLIPNRGILCLEVKGGQFSISRGQWYRPGDSQTVEPPVEQSEKAMFALKKELSHHFSRGHDAIRSCPIGFAVAFTDWDWPAELSRPISLIYDSRVLNTLGEFAYRLATDVQGLGNPIVRRRSPKPPTIQTVERLVNYLAPNVMTIVTIASQLGVIEYKLNILTEEQHPALDIVRDNDRCLIKGAAGTGKTMLAMEYAHRAAQSGQRVGLLCFNVLLGNYLKEQTEKVFGVTAGAFWPHILRPLVLRGPHRDEFLHDEENEADEGKLYDNVYPLYAELALTDAGPQFDVFVVDEAQDLCRPPCLELMDLLLLGGLREGRWVMFGDFSNQSIFTDVSSDQEPEGALLRYFEHPARLNLTVNCRSTSAISRDAARISGFIMPETRPIDGPKPEYQYWEDDAELSDLLDKGVRRLLNQGVHIEDIVVLSKSRLENSCLDINRAYGGYRLAAYSRGERITYGSDDEKPRLEFCSIPAFKGMESQVVILIMDWLGEGPVQHDRDIDEQNAHAYAYIGMSRAWGALVVLANADLRGELESRLAG